MRRNGHVKQPRIRQQRISKGLTQQEYSEVLGIARTTLAWLESANSTRRPGWKLAQIIARATNRTPGAVLDEYAARRSE